MGSAYFGAMNRGKRETGPLGYFGAMHLDNQYQKNITDKFDILRTASNLTLIAVVIVTKDPSTMTVKYRLYPQ